MAYNFFPTAYQPYQIQPVQQPAQQVYQPTQPAQPIQTNSNIIWVQGEAGAKSYLVAPGSTVPLWDSEAQTIYIKSADATGMPTIKTIDYTIRENEKIIKEQASYMTKEDANEFRQELDDIKNEIAKMKKTARKKEEVREDE